MHSNIFQGYVIVGESTTPAMSALLTGNSASENCQRFKEGRTGEKGAGEIDEWPFIFKKLKQLGFATMWSEDQPDLGKVKATCADYQLFHLGKFYLHCH